MLKGVILGKFMNKSLHEVLEAKNYITIEGEFHRFTYDVFHNVDFFIIDPLLDINEYWKYMNWIKGNYPKAMVIVICANSNYVLKSLEYNVIDYITCPNNTDRIEKSLQRLTIYKNIIVESLHNIEIKTFKSFDMYIDSNYVNLGNNKSKELFAFLVHNKGNSVGWERIVENIWPDSDYEKGHSNLHSTSHKLRKKLNEFGIGYIYETNRDSYRINIQKCKIDLIEFESCLSSNDNLGAYKIYRGEYYDNESYEWSDFEKEEYKKKYNYICNCLIYG